MADDETVLTFTVTGDVADLAALTPDEIDQLERLVTVLDRALKRRAQCTCGPADYDGQPHKPGCICAEPEQGGS
jgi:hypothetical protein